MTYKTGPAARRALLDKAKAKADEHGGKVDDWLDQFVFQRFLARIFDTDPDGWLLKGGQALLVRSPDARKTRDIDIYRKDAADRDAAVDALRSAAEIDLGDFVRFAFATRDDHPDETRVVRMTFTPRVGGIKHNAIHIDLATSPPPTGEPERRPLEPAIPIDWPGAWPIVTLFPLVDHIADKICAMYEIRDGRPSSRVRDAIDLILIALQDNDIDGRVLQATLERQIEHRRSRGTVIDKPEAYRLPSDTWPPQYAKLATETPGLPASYSTIDAATPLLSTFLDPVLGGDLIGTWDHQNHRWRSASTPKEAP